MEIENDVKDCCNTYLEKKSKGFLSGLFYGLIPHTGCIAFILFTILGMTTLTAVFKPLLMNPYFFYILIVFSLVLATISVGIYLKRFGLLSVKGMKKKWKYLSVLYGTSISINVVLFLVIFPLAANMTTASPTGGVAVGLSQITLKVDIPCPGHAPLISEELKTINGIGGVKFKFPDYFEVNYDSFITSEEEIMSLEIFNTYPAEKISGEVKEVAPSPGCSRCGGCSGACGGTCGG